MLKCGHNLSMSPYLNKNLTQDTAKREDKILVELATFKPIFFKIIAQNMMIKDRANIISE